MNTLAIQEIPYEEFLRLMRDGEFVRVADQVGFETTEHYHPKSPIDFDARPVGSLEVDTTLKMIDGNTCQLGDLHFEVDKSRFFALSDGRDEDGEHFYLHIYAPFYCHVNGVRFGAPIPFLDFEVPEQFAQESTVGVWL